MAELHAIPETANAVISGAIQGIVDNIGLEVKGRGFKAARKLHNALNVVLQGQRSGKRYKMPGTYGKKSGKAGRKRGVCYTASAPGEPPAVRTNAFRASWTEQVKCDSVANDRFTAHSAIESKLRVKNGHLLGDYLENGTPNGKMAPRPYAQRTIDRAAPDIEKIYAQPYTGG